MCNGDVSLAPPLLERVSSFFAAGSSAGAGVLAGSSAGTPAAGAETLADVQSLGDSAPFAKD